jgi:hypothetical protein
MFGKYDFITIQLIFAITVSTYCYILCLVFKQFISTLKENAIIALSATRLHNMPDNWSVSVVDGTIQ